MRSPEVGNRFGSDPGPWQIQQRPVPLEEFRALLLAVGHLEEAPAGERLRWLELLSYIEALIYHEWDRPGQPGLRQANAGTGCANLRSTGEELSA